MILLHTLLLFLLLDFLFDMYWFPLIYIWPIFLLLLQTLPFGNISFLEGIIEFRQLLLYLIQLIFFRIADIWRRFLDILINYFACYCLIHCFCWDRFRYVFTMKILQLRQTHPDFIFLNIILLTFWHSQGWGCFVEWIGLSLRSVLSGLSEAEISIAWRAWPGSAL